MVTRYTIFLKHAIANEQPISIRKSNDGTLFLIDTGEQSHPSPFGFEPISGDENLDSAINIFEEIDKIGVSSYLDKFMTPNS